MSSCDSRGQRCPDCWAVCHDGQDLLLHRVTECVSLTLAERYTEAFLNLNHPTSPAQGPLRKALKAAIVGMADQLAQ